MTARAEHGFAVVKQAVQPAELEEARRLLWKWLGETHYTGDGHPTHGWDRNDPTTWSDVSFGEGQALGGEQQRNNASRYGMMGAACHSEPFWYIRTLSGVIDGFAAAYGTHELVTAFDRLAVNRPLTCDSEAIKLNEPGLDGTAFDQCNGSFTRTLTKMGTDRTS